MTKKGKRVMLDNLDDKQKTDQLKKRTIKEKRQRRDQLKRTAKKR